MVVAAPASQTLSQMIDGYLASGDFTSLTPKTQQAYLRVLNDMRAEMGDHSPRSLKPSNVAEIRDRMSDQPGRAYNTMTVISALYRWGVELGWADINPAKGVRKPELGEHEAWPPEALEAIRSFPARVAWVCVVGLYTGQRLGDVLAMRRSNLRPGGKLYVKQMKTGKELYIPLHRNLVSALDGASEFICEQSPGKSWNRGIFRDAFVEAVGRAVKAGLMPRVVFHGLRKNATVALVEAGCTTSEAASITGHSLKMVEHYTKAVQQAKLAVTAMGKYDLYPVQGE